MKRAMIGQRLLAWGLRKWGGTAVRRGLAEAYLAESRLAGIKCFLLTGNDKSWKTVERPEEFQAFLAEHVPLFRRDFNRLFLFYTQLGSLAEAGVAGDLAEVGVYRGRTARLLHALAPERDLHLFDTFAGQPANEDRERDGASYTAILGEVKMDDTSLEGVRAFVGSGPRIHYHVGYFPTTAAPVAEQNFALVHLDGDQYQTILDGLDFFLPRLSPGGTILVHDHGIYQGVRRAVAEGLARHPRPLTRVPWPDAQGTLVLASPR